MHKAAIRSAVPLSPNSTLQATFDPLRILASARLQIASNAPERGGVEAAENVWGLPWRRKISEKCSREQPRWSFGIREGHLRQRSRSLFDASQRAWDFSALVQLYEVEKG